MRDIFTVIGIAFSLTVIFCFLFGLILFIKDQITKWQFTKEQQINVLIEMARAEKDIRVRQGIIMAVRVLKTGEQKNDKARSDSKN